MLCDLKNGILFDLGVTGLVSPIYDLCNLAKLDIRLNAKMLPREQKTEQKAEEKNYLVHSNLLQTEKIKIDSLTHMRALKSKGA